MTTKEKALTEALKECLQWMETMHRFHQMSPEGPLANTIDHAKRALREGTP